MKNFFYLHIGNFKTGSTSLQQFLFINKNILKKKNINVIEEKNFFKKSINNMKLFKFFNEKDNKKIKKYLAKSKKNLFISSEYFSSMSYDLDKLKFLKKTILKLGFTPKIIFFYRNDLSYLYSFYRETLTVKKYLKKPDSVFALIKKIHKYGYYFYEKNNNYFLNNNYYFNNKKIIHNWKKIFKTNFYSTKFIKSDKSKIYLDIINFLKLDNNNYIFPKPANVKKVRFWQLKRIFQKFFFLFVQLFLFKRN